MSKAKVSAKTKASAKTKVSAKTKASAKTRTGAKAGGTGKPTQARTKPSKAQPSAGSSDWREETLAQMRKLILEADPEMNEERKWVKATNPAGVPLWSHAGMVCTGEIYKAVVKITFAYGASLPDPSGLFNSSLAGGTRRAIDIHEGEKVDPRAFKALVKAAVARNRSATNTR